LAIPAFLFYQMANAEFSSNVNWRLFTAFYLPVLACYLLSFCINYFFHSKHSQDSAASAVFALAASYSNTVIVGLPVLLLLLGEQVIGILFLVITFHSALLFGITSAFAAKGEQFEWRKFLLQTFNNPLIIAILGGLAFNLFAIEIPSIIANSLELLGKPAISLALFVLGGSLAFYHIKSELRFIIIASINKLLLLPTIVFGLATYVFALDHFVVTILVVITACPIGVNAYLISLQQNKHQETVAGSVVVSTLLSVLTIPLWLSAMGYGQ